jgi:acetolactate synthase-1/2/3 large subunit
VTGLVADRIVEVLLREGVEHLVGFPENRLINSAALAGVRPIITRTERVAVNTADGFARATDGERILPCATQYGPGVEAAFAAVAQAHGDRSPILLLPTEHAVADEEAGAFVTAERAYAPVTRFRTTVRRADAAPEAFRRALQALRSAGPGPVLVAVSNDVMNAPAGAASWEFPSPARHRGQAAPDDVAALAGLVSAASAPVILAGQGVLYAGATAELVALAEHLGAPVATTLNGKSAFPEDHPLALGTAARTRPAAVDAFYGRADVVLAVGTSLTRSLYITPLPAGAVIGQVVDDPRDVATGYAVSAACVGDARLVLSQLLAELSAPSRPSAAAEVRAAREAFMAEWMPRLTSGAAPLSPYRVVWELMQVVDRTRTVVTHDAGHPRDQIVPFYEAVVPRGYLGWGKSTQLGTGFGLALGAKLARPDRLAVNIMGDAAFGMIGMDFETAVRARIPVVTIVLRNGLMGGYGRWMPDAVERHGADRLGGDYAAVAEALGGHAERVATPGELRPALERAVAAAADRPVLVEVATHEEPVQPDG